ncbi:hypothetical protein [Haliangium sp.]|uniref:hypothetical protein n=1 Tax=Haliangium sp. TaxID=2663208 RepID=UPI003D0F6E6E
MTPTRLLAGLGAGLLFSACATGTVDDTSADLGALSVESSESRLWGSFELGADSLRFDSRAVGVDEFDVVVELNGMMLTAVVDRSAQVAEIDGFAAAGSDTQMVDSDRVVLEAFTRALAAETDTEQFAAAAMLYRVASSWSQTPDTVPLQRQVASSGERAFTSICGFFGQFVEATHDGNQCDRFDDNCTSIAEVGRRTSATFSFINGQWTTQVPDHRPLVFQLGECYGNCGAGCPSGGQTLTFDCHDHDQCVRNGHFIASLFCDDEFVSAADDEFFAPTCSGT